jgi:type II secretory pathway component GspD/PulD (secretin)
MRMRRLALVCLAGVWLALPASAQVVRLYEVRHRAAEELLPIAQTALAGEGRVVADPRSNTLVLSGPREAVESALALLGTLDVRARTVVLHYESRGARELAGEGVRVAWSLDAGSLRVGNVVRPGEGSRIAVALDERAGQGSGRLSGQLRILDGETGRIATGVSLPVTTRRVRRGRFGPELSEATHHVSAESGFEARPRVLGDGRIELALRPFDASLRPDGALSTSGADTVLVVEPGRTVAIGGILRESQARRSGAFDGAASGEAADEQLLLVTAEIE